jgi:hypothetical protein
MSLVESCAGVVRADEKADERLGEAKVCFFERPRASVSLGAHAGITPAVSWQSRVRCCDWPGRPLGRFMPLARSETSGQWPGPAALGPSHRFQAFYQRPAARPHSHSFSSLTRSRSAIRFTAQPDQLLALSFDDSLPSLSLFLHFLHPSPGRLSPSLPVTFVIDPLCPIE